MVYAAETVRICGQEGLGLVYPWVFVSYGLAGIAGPALGGFLTDALGNFQVATLLATVVAAAGTLATCAPSRSRANSLRVLHSLEDRN